MTVVICSKKTTFFGYRNDCYCMHNRSNGIGLEQKRSDRMFGIVASLLYSNGLWDKRRFVKAFYDKKMLLTAISKILRSVSDHYL